MVLFDSVRNDEGSFCLLLRNPLKKAHSPRIEAPFKLSARPANDRGPMDWDPMIELAHVLDDIFGQSYLPRRRVRLRTFLERSALELFTAEQTSTIWSRFDDKHIPLQKGRPADGELDVQRRQSNRVWRAQGRSKAEERDVQWSDSSEILTG